MHGSRLGVTLIIGMALGGLLLNGSKPPGAGLAG